MPPYPGFVGGSYVAQSSTAMNARLVNWYLEPTQVEGGTSPIQAYPAPGVERVATGTSAPGRGSFGCRGRLFLVMGSQLVEMSTIYGLTVLGTMATDNNPATLAWNGDGGGQLFITSGNAGYCYDLDTETFSTVTMPGGATQCVALDGYILVLDADASTVWISDLLDATTFDPTQYVQRSIASDPWVAIAVAERFLWFLGQETSEAWFDAGAFPIPIEPHSSGLIQHGCWAPWSVQVVGGVLRFLGRTAEGSGNVIAVTGFTPEVISSFAVHAQLDLTGTLSDAVADVYEDGGHIFYLLSVPDAGTTFVYDAAPTLGLRNEQRWSERATWVAEEARFIAARTRFHIYAFEAHFALDSDGEGVYHVRSDFGFDVDDRPLVRLRRAPSLWNDGMRVHVPQLEVYFEPGVALLSGQGSDPQVTLRVSKNGGKTWGPERSCSLGARGDYNARVRFNRGGAGARWQPEILVSDPIPWRLLGASIRGAS